MAPNPADFEKGEAEERLLSTKEATEDFRPSLRKTSSSWLRIVAFSFLTAFLTFSTVGVFFYYATPHQHLKHCGGLSVEERAIMCKFDIMSFSWLPPACFDQELIDEFNSVKDWGYWEHKMGAGGTVSMEEANKGLRDLYVSWDHHKHHCMFMIKKLHRAVVSGRPIDSYVGNYGHTKHCERMLFSNETDSLSIALVNSPILVKTPACGLENWNSQPLDISEP